MVNIDLTLVLFVYIEVRGVRLHSILGKNPYYGKALWSGNHDSGLHNMTALEFNLAFIKVKGYSPWLPNNDAIRLPNLRLACLEVKFSAPHLFHFRKRVTVVRLIGIFVEGFSFFIAFFIYPSMKIAYGTGFYECGFFMLPKL